MIKICEIFSSLQGEVQGLGKPCLFIRTFGCNLGEKCPVDCDTPYSWNAAGRDEITEYTAGEIGDVIQKARPTRVVFTGGEPLLFKDDIERIVRLIVEKIGSIRTIYIETNGTIDPGRYLSGNPAVSFNVSPKLTRTNYSVFPRDRTVYKFVAKPSDADRDELLTRIKELPEEARRRACIMPEAKTRDEYLDRAADVAEFCIEHGINFGPRLHLLLWGGKRGK
ncbi:MAG: 7-carboxy-7-deazaguanine synthase QueE [Promethearchaeota archaeon]